MNDWAKAMTGCAAIPMRTLIPDAFDNVIVGGRCIAAEIQLVNSIRMMNTCMTTGEAAGLMCVLAKKKNKHLKDLEYSELLPLLRENNFILE